MNQSPQYKKLRDLDFKYLWHPFTQSSVWNESDPLIIERGEGMELIDCDGKRYLDGISSLWCTVHGHSHPRLNAALAEQAGLISHSTLLGLSHRRAIELAAELQAISPPGLDRIFYCDSGASAVEAGLRMALEWWYHRGDAVSRMRTRIAALEGAYHGDTLGSVAVGFAERFHRGVEPALIKGLQVPPPHHFRFEFGMTEDEAVEASLGAIEKLFNEQGSRIAVFAIEPLVQGAAGIWIHPPRFLSAVAELCTRFEILLLCDEIATGFGKTGTMFASEQAGISPDIMTIGKGLTGGYMPMSAVLASERIYSGFTGPVEKYNTFFFGQTFSGNPLGAALALASLALFKESEILSGLTEKCRAYGNMLDELVSPLPQVDEVRRCGLMTGIELTKEPGKRVPFDPTDRAGLKITLAARERGLIIRPLGNVIVLMPAVAMPIETLERLVRLTADSIWAGLGSK